MFVFGNYRLDADKRELSHNDRLVPIEPQVFDLLVYLIRHRDRVVSKDELLAAVWAGRIVSDSTLTTRINAARQAVNDTGKLQHLIRTIPRKGIRFVGSVADASTSPDKLVANVGQLANGKPSIAVLPFANISAEPDQEYFSDGITDEIISALSRLHWFFVIARNSTFAYKGQARDVRDIGRDLGVRYILEGSVRRSGQRARVTSQLLDATTGNHIWSDRYDRELHDILAVQDEITSSVVAAIEPKLLAAEGLRATARQVKDIDAWDLGARALVHFWRLTQADSAIAISILRRAVQEYPNYAPAHSMLACALLVSSYMMWTSPDSERHFAAQLAYRAVTLDDADPWALLALGIVAVTSRLTDDAIRYFEGALALNPNFSTAAGFVGFALALDGQSDRALPYLERAIRMSPRDPFNSFFLAGSAVAHYLQDRQAEAIKWSKLALQVKPEYIGGHRILCASLAQAGRYDECAASLAVLRRLAPDISLTLARLSVPYTPRTIDQFIEGLRKAGVPK